MKNRFSFSKSSRRDLLRAGMYGVGVSAAALPMPLFAQAAAQLAGAGQSERKDTGGARTLRRQRRAQHAGSLWRRRVLSSPPEPRHPAQGRAPHRRSFRIQPRHGRLRTPVQGRQAGHRARLRLRESVVLALHFDGLLAHRRSQQRRAVRLGGPPGGCDGARRAAQFPGEYRHAAIARGSQPPACAGGLRRSQQIFARNVLRRARGAAIRQRRPADLESVATVSFWIPPRAPRKPRRWCAKRGRNIIRRSITASSDSICPRWRR